MISYGYGCYLSKESILIYFTQVKPALEARYGVHVALELVDEHAWCTKVVIYIGRDSFYDIIEINAPLYIDSHYISILFNTIDFQIGRVVKNEKGNNNSSG